MGWIYQQKPPMGWPLDLSEPINEGLVGYWYMPEGSGVQVFDLSGNNNKGILTGTAPSWLLGKFGSSVNFPGTDEYILGTTKGMSVNAGTIVLWFNADVVPSGVEGNVYMFGHRTGADDNRIYMLIKDDASTIVFGHGDTAVIDTGVTPSAGVWYQLALTWSGDTVNYYINAVNYGPTTTAVLSSIDNNFRVGGLLSAHPFGYFNGRIDYIPIYNRTLSPSEIALLYRFPFYGFMNPDEIPVLDQYYTVAVGTILPQITSAYMRMSL